EGFTGSIPPRPARSPAPFATPAARSWPSWCGGPKEPLRKVTEALKFSGTMCRRVGERASARSSDRRCDRSISADDGVARPRAPRLRACLSPRSDLVLEDLLLRHQLVALAEAVQRDDERALCPEKAHLCRGSRSTAPARSGSSALPSAELSPPRLAPRLPGID